MDLPSDGIQFMGTQNKEDKFNDPRLTESIFVNEKAANEQYSFNESRIEQKAESFNNFKKEFELSKEFSLLRDSQRSSIRLSEESD